MLGADLIILAIPFGKIASLPRGLFDLRQAKAFIIRYQQLYYTSGWQN
ncbi:hypothetical protein ACT7DH_00370 [Bacillus pacificus]